MKQDSECTTDSLPSQVISFLRFPLIVGIVLIHTSVDTALCEAHSIYTAVLYVCQQVLSGVAVPLFFIFSGYLLFNKTTAYTTQVYLAKLKSRCRTLLVPYVVWNMIAVGVYNLSASGMVCCVEDFIRAFWNLRVEDGGGTTTPAYPILVPFWYVRDLMVLVLLSPIAYWCTKKFSYWWLLLLGILWISGVSCPISGLSLTGVFFFSFGAYSSIHKKNVVAVLTRYTLLVAAVFLGVVVLEPFMQDTLWISWQHIRILVGVLLALSCVARMIETGVWRMPTFLSDSSFFIFASHIFILSVVGRLLSRIIPQNSEANLILCYFLLALLTVLIGIVGYHTLKKCLPKITALLTGGR